MHNRVGLRRCSDNRPIYSPADGPSLDGSDRIDLGLLGNALSDGRFLFDAADIAGIFEDPSTGFLDVRISGGVGLPLDIGPPVDLDCVTAPVASHGITATRRILRMPPPTHRTLASGLATHGFRPRREDGHGRYQQGDRREAEEMGDNYRHER